MTTKKKRSDKRAVLEEMYSRLFEGGEERAKEKSDSALFSAVLKVLDKRTMGNRLHFEAVAALEKAVDMCKEALEANLGHELLNRNMAVQISSMALALNNAHGSLQVLKKQHAKLGRELTKVRMQLSRYAGASAVTMDDLLAANERAHLEQSLNNRAIKAELCRMYQQYELPATMVREWAEDAECDKA